MARGGHENVYAQRVMHFQSIRNALGEPRFPPDICISELCIFFHLAHYYNFDCTHRNRFETVNTPADSMSSGVCSRDKVGLIGFWPTSQFRHCRTPRTPPPPSHSARPGDGNIVSEVVFSHRHYETGGWWENTRTGYMCPMCRGVSVLKKPPPPVIS